MLNDNWHKRFGKMWVVIVIIGFGLFIEVECRTCMNETLLRKIEDNQIEIINQHKLIDSSRIADSAMFYYLTQSKYDQNHFKGSFNLDRYISTKIVKLFKNISKETP